MWKVYVKVHGEDYSKHGWSTNAMAYDTKPEAERAARDLMSRWLLVTEWKVREVDEKFAQDPDFKKEVIV